MKQKLPNLFGQFFCIQSELVLYSAVSGSSQLATEIPVNMNIAKKMIRFSSFACFPKYKGLSETQYKKLITRRKKNIERSIKKTKEYLDQLDMSAQSISFRTFGLVD